MKKEVYAMTRPVPLMFIKSPQALVRLPDQQEENKLTMAQEESLEKIAPKIDGKEIPEPEENLIVQAQLQKAQSPFGRHLYQPLLFKLTNQKEVLGILEEVAGSELVILQDDYEGGKLTLPIHEIDDILWHGKSLGE